MIRHNDTAIAHIHASMEGNDSPSTGENASEYWVTRVVRQMKGCSPGKIDSVIQANLPPRRIRWSQRPDTLEIPGLEGRVAYSTDNLPKCYHLGFFQGNPLLHPELEVRPRGIQTDPIPHHPRQDNIISTLLILCFVLMSFVIHSTRRFLSHQSHEFFQSSEHKDNHIDPNMAIGIWSTILVYILLGLTGCILFFYYAQNNFNLFLCDMPSHRLLGIYFVIFMLFFVARKALSSFINWIFFDKTSRQEWRLSYNFLLVYETSALLACTAIGVYINCSAEVLIYSVFAIIALFKITLLYKAYKTFSFKIYGFMHLLSYLCALEIIPLMALGVLLMNVTDSLITKF
jgi:hypothetical protein